VESSSVPHLKGRFSALTSGNGVVWWTKTRQLTTPKRALRVGKSFRRPSQIFGAVFFPPQCSFLCAGFYAADLGRRARRTEGVGYREPTPAGADTPHPFERRRDVRHDDTRRNDTRHNGIRHNGLLCNTRHK